MKQSKIKLAIVGVGKIVHDQHLPSIATTGGFELVATASRNGFVEGVSAYQDIGTMLADKPQIQAVSLCMPPQFRFAAAQQALSHGVDVLLEKPPGATVTEVEMLAKLAKRHKACLYATWHSRHAIAVESARRFLAQSDLEIVAGSIHWKEDVRKWHPGQEWIWQVGGMGVFDPGINGLSILTSLLPEAVYVDSAQLIYPQNRSAPIAANVEFKTLKGTPFAGQFDWRVTGDETWSIEIETNQGTLNLLDGGARLVIDGEAINCGQASNTVEYEAIYRHFAGLISSRQSDVDLAPLKLVADIFLTAETEIGEPFNN